MRSRRARRRGGRRARLQRCTAAALTTRFCGLQIR